MKTIIYTLKILGTLFYHKRGKSESVELVRSLVTENVLQAETLHALTSLTDEQLERDFSVVFEEWVLCQSHLGDRYI